MTFQIINERGLASNLAQALGGGFGTGLSQGLERRQQAGALAQLLGITPEEARQYTGLDPQILKEVIKGKRLKEEASKYTDALDAFEAYKEQGEPGFAESVLQEQPSQKPSLSQMFETIAESKLKDLYQPAAAQLGIKPSESPQAGQAIEKEIKKETAIKKQAKSELQQFKDYIRKNKIKLTPEQRKEAEKQILERETLAEERKKNALTETRKYREKVNEDYEAVRDQLQDLDRLEELNKENKLNDPAWNTFLKEADLDIGALYNPESVEFQKTALGFLRSGRSIFGNRLTDLDVKQLLQMIPSLSQSPKGRARIIGTLRRLARGKEMTFKTMRDIMRENKGVPPDDLRDQVNERLEKPLNQLYKQFKKELVDMEKLLPEGPSTAAVLGSALAGKTLKVAPGALAGGAAGALLGGLPGALLGALGGAYVSSQRPSQPFQNQPFLMPPVE